MQAIKRAITAKRWPILPASPAQFGPSALLAILALLLHLHPANRFLRFRQLVDAPAVI
jgi:hypothetical protein